MSVKLKSITKTSWLVLNDTEDIRVGLLTEIQNNYVLMAQGEKTQFLNRKEVNKYFKEDVFENVIDIKDIEDSKKDYFINGYPVNFENPHEIHLKDNTLPLFSKKSDGEIYYSAGYFCLYFPKNIMGAFCPKLSTLQLYKYEGPFKTEEMMKFELARIRRIQKENI